VQSILEEYHHVVVEYMMSAHQFIGMCLLVWHAIYIYIYIFIHVYLYMFLVLLPSNINIMYYVLGMYLHLSKLKNEMRYDKVGTVSIHHLK
jgi:hypothetical protein